MPASSTLRSRARACRSGRGGCGARPERQRAPVVCCADRDGRSPSTPSLVLFLVGGALIGAGAGLVFKGTTGIVLEAAAPEERVAMTSTLIITALFGLSIPVVGAGVALSQGVSAANTVLGFGTAVALGVALSGWALLSRRASGPRGVA